MLLGTEGKEHRGEIQFYWHCTIQNNLKIYGKTVNG